MSDADNIFWKRMGYPGRPRIYATGDELWKVFTEYWEWNKTKSWAKEDFIKSGPGAGDIVETNTQNPPSILRFCLFANISEQTFRDYTNKNGENASEFVAVCSAIRALIQSVQVEGATVNIFNANIIARLTGLVDKKEVQVNENLSDDERNDLIKEILESAKKK